MAKSTSIDPKSGFCSETNIFHSLRPPAPLLPPNAPISISDHLFSLFHSSSSPETTALIDSATGHSLPYSEFFRQIEILATSLQTLVGLHKGDTALILSPTTLEIPILYLALLSLGVIISPSNPFSTKSEISRQIELSKPVIAFATSITAHKLPSFRHQTILLDSPQFRSLKTTQGGKLKLTRVEVSQSDLAAILFSSGTTGRFKGVMLTHRNCTANVTATHSLAKKREFPAVVFPTVPYFHVYGFIHCLKSVAVGETVVVMEWFDVKRMMKAVEDFKVTHLAVAPPVVVAMLKNDSTKDGYDMSSLEAVTCGGAPLGNKAIDKLSKWFPMVLLAQAYGLTETTGGVFRAFGSEECGRLGATGRLSANCEAKIVDPETGVVLSPCNLGELWVRGAAIMKGYVGDEEATSAALNSDGWLRTGDLCYIDNDGYLFVLDRIKELIKCKGYQVAPAELEQLLQSHPDIVDAAVIPYPDEDAGQVPMAFVVRRLQSSLDEVEVMEFVAKQVAPYKKIRRVAFINSIPKNAPGKILRKDLIKLALSRLTAKL